LSVQRAVSKRGGDNSTLRSSVHPGGMAGTIAGTGFVDTNIKWTINGYIYGNMPLMTMKQGDHVRWYVATLGDFNNAHTPHWRGNTVLVRGRRTDVISIVSAEMVTADMEPDAAGIWLYRCHIRGAHL
jgi:manganese oxidase